MYHAVPWVRVQNVLMLIGSYVFYGWWDWRFMPLLAGISLANYVGAILIEQTADVHRRRAYLIVALAISLLALAVFKYFNFFIGSAVVLAHLAGFDPHVSSLQIILPLGISFMTFQGLAYVIDVYRGEHAAERDLVRFFAFKAFFPQLVAGPIERASNLLDQFTRPRELTEDKVRRALWLLVYGYALKIVVADSMAVIVDSLFVEDQPFGWSTVLGTMCFGLQIYADFNGYSLIAKGVALLFGFELIWNFRFPYWATSPSDFWRRWHISLSTWLRDYLYIPLGGNRRGRAMSMRNMLITMALGGLWHGASWNFVAWGLLHGIALGVWRVLRIPTVPTSFAGRTAGWVLTIAIVFIGWLLFRASSEAVLIGMMGALGNWEWAPVHDAVARALLTLAILLAALE